MIKDWGMIYTIKYWKQMRLHCTRYICGHPLLTNTMSIGLTKDGWPKRLLFLKPLVDAGLTSNLKFVLTILNISRAFILSKSDWDKVKPNYSSITDPQKGSYVIPSGFINKFVKKYRLHSPKPSFSKDLLYLSAKAGPEGPATLTSYGSLLTYSYPEMDKILKITDEEGRNFFTKSYKHAWDKWIVNKRCKSNGKLSFIKDPEAKLRIIAISDYFTQIYLKPIHEKIMYFLKSRFPCDRTFTQDPNNVWNVNEESFWSLDLSSATDRFPIDIQRRLLTRIFRDDIFADSWSFLLSNRMFESPEGDLLKYSTGQPMGTYSSWPVFTLSHHLVVHWCAHLCGIEDFDQYILLGDDIVIKHDKVAKTYIHVMTSMGVEISVNKTHVSKNTYEFAKRWIRPLEKIEITGLPLKGIFSNFSNPYIVFITLYDFFKIKKNQYYSKYSLVKLVIELYRNFSMFKGKGKIYLSLNYRQFLSLKILGLSLDIEFDYFSYDKLRELFTILSKNPQYPIPADKVALLYEYKRILLVGMSDLIGSINNRIISNPDLLLSKFEVEDKNELNVHPMFVAIYNTIRKSWSIVHAWTLKDTVSLHNASKEIHDLDIDSLFKKERNTIRPLLNIGKMVKNGFHILNQTDEIYYGSATTESTFTAPLDRLRIIQMNFNNCLLESVMEGNWQPPRTTEDVISAWENFKL